MAADERAPSIDEITSVERSTLDREEARARLERWLAGRLGAGASVEIPALSSPSGSGMSSDTLLFDARVRTDAGEETLSLVARLAPQHRDVPVFPSYDLAAQFRLLGLVAAQGGVPVPRVRWLETDAAHLGAPFLAMDRVEGRVPSDVPPYVFAGFVLEASDAERATLERSTVEAMAALHAIDAERADAGFLAFPVKGDTPLERHVENQRDYYAWVVADGVRHPLLERTFAWLDAHWPAHESEPVISWGDSRIGNVIYRGFEPAALLEQALALRGQLRDGRAGLEHAGPGVHAGDPDGGAEPHGDAEHHAEARAAAGARAGVVRIRDGSAGAAIIAAGPPVGEVLPALAACPRRVGLGHGSSPHAAHRSSTRRRLDRLRGLAVTSASVGA